MRRNLTISQTKYAHHVKKENKELENELGQLLEKALITKLNHRIKK